MGITPTRVGKSPKESQGLRLLVSEPPRDPRSRIVHASRCLSDNRRYALQKLDRAAQDAERERQQLAGLIGTVRTQAEQRNSLLWTGCIAFAVALTLGLLVSPTLAGTFLPSGAAADVAAIVMNADRWNAGIALMRAGSPDGWRAVADAANLVRVNHKALTACREAAAKAKKEQRCTITVSAQ